MASAFITTMNDKQRDDGAALVCSTNARSGLSDQRRSARAARIAGSVMPFGTSTMNATMPIISKRRGFAQRAAMPMIVPVSIPGISKRKHVMRNHLNLRRAHAQRRFADRRRHALQRGARRDDDGRQGQQREHQRADERRRARHAEEAR